MVRKILFLILLHAVAWPSFAQPYPSQADQGGDPVARRRTD